MADVPAAAVMQRLLQASGAACFWREAGALAWLASPGASAMLGMGDAWATVDDAWWSERVHPEDSFDFFTVLAELQEGGEPAVHAVRLRHGDGSWRNFRCVASSDAAGVVLALTDQTSQRQVEAALVDSQIRLRSLHDTAPVAIILWSREGRITEWNRAAEQTFGHARDAAVGAKLVPLLIDPQDYTPFSEAVTCALRDNLGSEVTCRTLRADGKPLRCQWRSVPLRSPKGGLLGIFSLALDVTEQLAAADELARARDAAQALSRAKTDFLSVISHELRTPLNGILGMAQLLELAELGEDEKGFLKIIHDSGTTLLEIVNAIVRYNEVDAVALEAAEVAFSLREVVMLGCERFEMQARRQGLDFLLELDSALPDELNGDRRSFETALACLIDNAVKFTEAGNIAVRITGGDAAGGQAVRLRCEVHDTGIGMAPDFLAQLYTPFRQAEDAIRRKRGGVGLGLALAKKLVDRLGGSLDVTSEPGAGSRFVLQVEFKRAG